MSLVTSQAEVFLEVDLHVDFSGIGVQEEVHSDNSRSKNEEPDRTDPIDPGTGPLCSPKHRPVHPTGTVA